MSLSLAVTVSGSDSESAKAVPGRGSGTSTGIAWPSKCHWKWHYVALVGSASAAGVQSRRSDSGASGTGRVAFKLAGHRRCGQAAVHFKLHVLVNAVTVPVLGDCTTTPNPNRKQATGSGIFEA